MTTFAGDHKKFLFNLTEVVVKSGRFCSNICYMCTCIIIIDFHLLEIDKVSVLFSYSQGDDIKMTNSMRNVALKYKMIEVYRKIWLIS